MNEITVPYHLAIPVVISALGLLMILYRWKSLFSKRKVFWTSVTVFLIVYLLIVGDAAYFDIYYQWALNQYDLNKDGLFSGREITSEQQAAMLRLTSDVGRNLSFITGFIFAFLISATVFLFGKLIRIAANRQQ